MEKTPSGASILLTLTFAYYFFSKKTYNNSEQINCGTNYNKVDSSHFFSSSFSSNSEQNLNNILSKANITPPIINVNMKPNVYIFYYLILIEISLYILQIVCQTLSFNITLNITITYKIV